MPCRGGRRARQGDAVSPMTDVSPREWTRVEYMNVHAPSTGRTKVATAVAPAVVINVRNPGAEPDGREEVVRARGLLDTGASVSSMPM